MSISKYFEYRSLKGSINLSEDDGNYYGKIYGIKEFITYFGRSEDELERKFISAVDNYLKSFQKKKNEIGLINGIIDEQLLHVIRESIWIMRWNDSKTALYAVLTESEAEKVCGDILKSINSAGYIIIKKES